MRIKQAIALDETGHECLRKAQACTTSKEVQSFTDLGLKCLAEARQILDENQRNSVLVFYEVCLHLGRAGGPYPAYLEFCARNQFQTLSEIDFTSISEKLANEP